MPFFSIFVWNITALMPIFCRKNVHSLKNTLFSFHEKHPAVKPIYCQKSLNSVKTTLYYGPKKSKGYPFFSNFSRKNDRSHAHILSKKRSFSKKHTAIFPIFVKKCYFSIKHVALISNYSFFCEKPPVVMPISGQKNVNSVKTTQYHGLKNQ